MRIGFVSAWYERGAAYVTRAYLDLVKDVHDVFVYARGGGSSESNSPEWNQDYVTYGYELPGTEINYKHFSKWIEINRIDRLFFNEQREFSILYRLKLDHPDVVIGAYIDYYTVDTIPKFAVYDYLICNTKRHYSAFSWHPQCYYVPWGTDTELYNAAQRKKSEKVRFFHSMGTTTRKGTASLINAFIAANFGDKAELIIHTQIPISVVTSLSNSELREKNISVIEKTVPAPGLYYCGDVYVYPTKLDGLGLTVFEALASGMPVITTDFAPMNEIVTEDLGKLVSVQRVYCRGDGYYWPMTDVDEKALASAMQYYVMHCDELCVIQRKCRSFAVSELNWKDRQPLVLKCFEQSRCINFNKNQYMSNVVREDRARKSRIRQDILYLLPDWIRTRLYHKLNQKKVFKRS